jgi:hypothetical protein
MRDDLTDIIREDMSSNAAWETIQTKYEKQSMTGILTTFDALLEHINAFRQSNLRLNKTDLKVIQSHHGAMQQSTGVNGGY